ncbi:MAG: CpaF family protein [Hungatella sp.]|nr:CpaF family protein [Hungatella sp.]
MNRRHWQQNQQERKEKMRLRQKAMKEAIHLEISGMQQIEDEQLQEIIDRHVLAAADREHLPLKDRLTLRNNLFNSFRKLDILQQLMDNPEITEVMINGKDHIFVEEQGKMHSWDYEFESDEQLEDMVQQVVSRVNRIVNVASPIADARLEDGSRVHVVLPPVSLDGPIMTIRKFPRTITMDMLVEFGTINEEAAVFLGKLVRSGYNIFISGGTNSGKTTFLNALSAFIPQEERVITIEDSAELQIQHVKNLVRLETRAPNSQGEGAIGIGELIRASLRMNPSRIIVGEVRGKEALELLNSYNTGHDGGMSSGHGNSPKDMLARLETMVLMGAELPLSAIRSQIASALDILIHVGRKRDKSRKVFWIEEVESYTDGQIRLHTLYQLEEDGLKKKGELKNRWKLQAAGEEDG